MKNSPWGAQEVQQHILTYGRTLVSHVGSWDDGINTLSFSLADEFGLRSGRGSDTSLARCTDPSAFDPTCVSRSSRTYGAAFESPALSLCLFLSRSLSSADVCCASRAPVAFRASLLVSLLSPCVRVCMYVRRSACVPSTPSPVRDSHVEGSRAREPLTPSAWSMEHSTGPAFFTELTKGG